MSRVYVKEIIRAAAIQGGVSVEEITSPARTNAISRPRQRAMYVACQLTNLSLATIGRLFGGRDHTTVLHARNKVADRIACETDELVLVDDLMAMFRPTLHATVAMVASEMGGIAA